MFINIADHLVLQATIGVPTGAYKSKLRRYPLDFNRYTRLSPLAKSRANQAFYKEVGELCGILPTMNKPVLLEFQYWNPSKRKSDLSNMVAILDKLGTDTLVKMNVLLGDTIHHIPQVVYTYMGYRKDYNLVHINIYTQEE